MLFALNTFLNILLFCYLGGFSESESFVGKLSFLDFWSRELNAIEIGEYYRTCDPYQGNLYSWTDLKFKTVGSIKIKQSEFCKPCDQNLTIHNAEVIYGEQTAFVKCSEGFQMTGSPFVFCLRTSKWELSKLPSCKVVKCNPLKALANGRMTLTKTSFNGQARFACDHGFTLIGSDAITCTANGNWSNEVPFCKSKFECPALSDPANGILVYASDSGIIQEKMSSYPIGTFLEIKCNPGHNIEGDNLISCSDQGVWDSEIEDCQPEDATNRLNSDKVPMEFWMEFKDYLFNACQSKSSNQTMFCRRFSSNFGTDLSSFELPETSEYEGMDSKLFNLLKNLLNSSELNSTTVGNFFEHLLRNHQSTSKLTRDSFRFVVCLYIDLIMLDEEFEETNDNISDESGNINDNIKKMLRKAVKPIYRNQLK